MSKETFTPHSWTYTDYLKATDKEDNSESKQRWQEVICILNTQYGEELQNVVSIIINHIDEEEIE
jgi:transposase-like protein